MNIFKIFYMWKLRKKVTHFENNTDSFNIKIEGKKVTLTFFTNFRGEKLKASINLLEKVFARRARKNFIRKIDLNNGSYMFIITGRSRNTSYAFKKILNRMMNYIENNQLKEYFTMDNGAFVFYTKDKDLESILSIIFETNLINHIKFKNDKSSLSFNIR